MRKAEYPKEGTGNFGKRTDGGQITEMLKSMADMREMIKKLAPDGVFPYRVPTAEGWILQ